MIRDHDSYPLDIKSQEMASRCARTTELFRSATIVNVRHVVVFLYTLALTLRCPFCNCSREKCHEFTDGTSLIERECREIGRIAENDTRPRWGGLDH
jgi:hypothetical protein